MGADLPQLAHAYCSPKQRTHNLTTGVYGWMIEILGDRITHPVQREPKEQGCNTKLVRGGGVEFRPTSDFVARLEGPKVATYGFKWC